MPTSLQKQLATIAATSSHQIDLKTQRNSHAQSLLFDHRVAISQDFHTIYQVCREGFEELCLLDPRFSAFSTTLFNEQSKYEERALKTAEENKVLDNIVERFLTLISSRLLLKPALKSLEWLVRRFRVHEHNTEIILHTFLPYHTNPNFLLLLAILPESLPVHFQFLRPYITSRTNPQRHLVISSAIKHSSLITAYSQYVISAARRGHHSAVVLKFWTGIVIQCVDGLLNNARSGRTPIQRQREEDVLLLVVPLISDAFKIKDAPELIRGCLMLILTLVSKADLNDTVLLAFADAITQEVSPDLLDESVVCLATIFQETKEIEISQQIFKSLERIEGFQAALISLSTKCRVERLSLAYLLASLRLHRKSAAEKAKIINVMISNEVLSSTQISQLLPKIRLFLKTHDELNRRDLEFRREMLSIASKIKETLKNEESEKFNNEVRLLESSSEETQVLEKLASSEQNSDTEMQDFDSAGRASEALGEVLEAMQLAQRTDISFINPSSPVQGAIKGLKSIMSSDTNPLGTLRKTLKSADVQRSEFTTSANYVTILLYNALEIKNERVREAAWLELSTAISNCSERHDFQALYPYIVASLCDSTKAVRRATSKCIQSISINGKAERPLAASSAASPLWASSLYATPVQWMSSEQSQKILASFLLAITEECIIDEAYIFRAFENRLSNQRSDESSTDELNAKIIKGTTRAAFIGLLGNHVSATSLLAVRCKIMQILNRLGKSSVAVRSRYLAPLAQDWCETTLEEAHGLCEGTTITIEEADKSYLQVFDGKEEENFSAFKKILAGEIGNSRLIDGTFKRLRDIWQKLGTAKRQIIVSLLLDLSLNKEVDTASQVRSRKASGTLRQLKYSSDVLIHLVESLSSPINDNVGAQRGSKRRRTSRSNMSRVEVFDTNSVMEYVERLTIVLEVVEGSNPGQCPGLLKGLFRVINELQVFRHQLGSENIYLQSLALDSLLCVVKKAKDNNPHVDTTVIRTDLLVDCIRSTSNAQIQSTSLLIISALAEWAPELVLHSVMPIFTFMGSTLLRQTDDYSAHVVHQTISCVVPPLLGSLRRGKKEFLTGIAELLLSFTAAYEHIPYNRRLDLFTQLISSLDSNECIAAIIAMLFDKYSESPSLPRFAARLFSNSATADIFEVLVEYEKILVDTFQSKRKYADVLFNFNEKNGTQIERTQICLISLLADFLHEYYLLSPGIKALTGKERDSFGVFFSSITQLRQRNGMTIDGKRACERVLSNSLAITSFEDLAKISEGLLESSVSEVCQTSLGAIEKRLKSLQHRDSVAAKALQLVPVLEKTVLNAKESQVQLKAIVCLQEIAFSFGKTDSSAILHTLSIISGDAIILSHDNAVRKSAVDCLGVFVNILRDGLAPSLPMLWPKLFKILNDSMTPESVAAMSLHCSAFNLMKELIDIIPYSASEKELVSGIELSHKSAAQKFGPKHGPAIDDARYNFLAQIGSLANQNCVMAVGKTWHHALTQGYFSCAEHLEILVLTLISSCSKASLNRNLGQLFQFFQDVLKYRWTIKTSHESLYRESEISKIDEHLVNVLMKLVLRLNDATFRPFFSQLVELGYLSKDGEGLEKSILCATSLYSFLEALFEELKSHVTGYSSYILELSEKILNSREDTSAISVLRINVHRTIRKAIEYDEEEYWHAPSHFNKIAQSLLNELTFCSSKMCIEEVIPTITELAASAASPDHHKDINSRLLKLLRPESSIHARLMAVKCEQGLTERLGEDWLTLLPEMLPLMSELLEADDEETEEASRAWMKKIEEILGTSIDVMLQ